MSSPDDFPNLDYAPKWERDKTVDFPQPSSQRFGWLTAGDFIIAVALGAVIGLLATGELRFAHGSGTKTIELTSSSDNSKMPEQLSSPSNRPAIAPTAPQATQLSSPIDSEIRFGISAPFTGPAKELGQKHETGYPDFPGHAPNYVSLQGHVDDASVLIAALQR